jgi:hypothetical protein
MSTKKKNKKSSNPNGKVCSNCFAPETRNAPLLSCARCGLAVYCGRDCQRAHWKTSHKQHCVTKADRVPQQQNPLGAHSFPATGALEGEKCSICLHLLSEEATYTLPCTHVFHGACVSELRKLGVKQACPLCRAPLPPGPEKVFEESTRRYIVVKQLVDRGYASWSALPTSAQQSIDAAVAGWRAAADEGFILAQHALGNAYFTGQGVPQNDAEALHWFRKAAEQGDANSQYTLGTLLHCGRGDAQSCQSDVEAASWCKKAAEQGHAVAQKNLGFLFECGHGVTQSDDEAAYWY